MHNTPDSNENSGSYPEVVRGPGGEAAQRALPSREVRPAGLYVEAFHPTTYGLSVNGSEDQGGVVDALRILGRHKASLAVCALLFGVIAFLITRSQRPIYQARASIELQDMNVALPSISRSAQEPQTYAVLSDLPTQIRILQSQTLASSALAKLRAATPAADYGPQQEAELKTVANSMSIRSPGDSRVIEVLVDSPNPRLAADYANTLASEYIDQNTDQRLKLNRRTADWLARQVDEMRRKLESSEHDLQAYAQRAGLLFTGNTPGRGANSVSEETLRQRQLSLSAATAERALKQARNQVATGSPPEALPEVLDDPHLRGLRTQITDLQRQVADLSAVYTSEFPKIKRLQAEIQLLERSFERERAAVIEKVRNEYQEAIERERLLLNDYVDQTKVVTDQSEKAIQYQILARAVDNNRLLYDAMLRRINESGIDAALKASSIRLLDPATVPAVPYKPNISINTAVGVLFGLFAGAVAVIVRARSDRSIKVPGETAPWLNVRELGVVPSFPKRLRLCSGQALALQRGSPMMAESFRVVLTSIIASGRKTFDRKSRSGRVIVCTSANPSEGKTTIAANLAIALVNIGERVLLIDADLSRPRLHEIFDVKSDFGLTTMLQSPAISNELLDATICETASGVYFVPAGPQLSGAADLLFARQMPELVSVFRENFDTVVIDTPPAPQLSQARLLGKEADGVLVILRAGRTTRQAALGLVQNLSEDGINILGTVLNDWNPKKAPSEYYGHASKAWK
jgi:succinoglycan biosynthesis transport protein ExoP